MEGGEESWKGGFTAEREGLVGGGVMPPVDAVTTRGILIISFRHKSKKQLVRHDKSHTQRA